MRVYLNKIYIEESRGCKVPFFIFSLYVYNIGVITRKKKKLPTASKGEEMKRGKMRIRERESESERVYVKKGVINPYLVFKMVFYQTNVCRQNFKKASLMYDEPPLLLLVIFNFDNPYLVNLFRFCSFFFHSVER